MPIKKPPLKAASSRALAGPDDRLGTGQGGAGRRIAPPDVQRVVHQACVKPQHSDRVAVEPPCAVRVDRDPGAEPADDSPPRLLGGR